MRMLGVMLLAVAASMTAGCQISVLDGLQPGGEGPHRQRVERALMANPENPHARFLAGRAALQADQPKDALRHFRMVVEVMPEFEEAWEGIGTAYLDQEKPEQAIQAFDEMIGRFPENPAGYEGLAAAYIEAGDLEAAQDAARQAAALGPGTAQAARLLGEVAYARSNYDQALAHWLEAAALDPEQAKELQPIIDDLEAFLRKY